VKIKVSYYTKECEEKLRYSSPRRQPIRKGKRGLFCGKDGFKVMNILEAFAKADFKRKDLPLWIRRLNYFALSPILLWPLIFYGTIFLFDNPKNILQTVFLFLAVNSYPLLLGGIVLLSYNLFPRNKFLAALLPLIPICLLLCFFIHAVLRQIHWWWQS